MKRIAIIQSNYIPWKGYFDIMNSVDEFIFLDDVQYTRRDWRNRNKIKTERGTAWLTIPVSIKGNYLAKIKDIKIVDKSWGVNHWQIIKYNYSKAKYFHELYDVVENLYLNCKEEYLTDINFKFISTINLMLGIKTKLRHSSEFKLFEGKNERLVEICRQTNASEYLSGPSAKDYINESIFQRAGIKLKWMDYSGYPEYNQLYSPFVHEVSIIDLIFNEGPNATKFMKSFIQ